MKVKAIKSIESGISGWEYKGHVAVFYPLEMCHKIKLDGKVYKIYSPEQLIELIDSA